MEQLLLWIKHHLGFFWKIIEWGNGIAFNLVYLSRLESILQGVFTEFSSKSFEGRKLNASDIELLHQLLTSQNSSDLEYFKPHSFDLKSLHNQLNNKAFLMMGIFNHEKLVGYFFLRFFINKKCFVGRLIDAPYRGQSIGLVMNNIMYEIAWRMGFRCLSTISQKNKAIMKAHAKNPKMIILKELKNDYILVEFKRKVVSR